MTEQPYSPFLEAEPGGRAEAVPPAVSFLAAETPFAQIAAMQPETAAESETQTVTLPTPLAIEAELWEAEDPSPVADERAAVPPFNFLKRVPMPVPLLSRTQSAARRTNNQQWHPAVSGVDPEQIRRQLSQYVNLTVVAVAIHFYNKDHPTDPVELGTPPVDAVFVEAVHQFQAKCYLEPDQVDGLAGESTLDSLGFITRRGLRKVNRVNSRALARLKAAAQQAEEAARLIRETTGGDYTGWFDHIVNPTFLGRPFNRGIHVELARRLRVAERWLLGLPAYQGMTPVELGRAFNLDTPTDREHDPTHKGHRPDGTSVDPDSNSMHTFGLGLDIRKQTNPHVSEKSLRSPFTCALQNAAALLGRTPLDGTAAASFDRLGTHPSLTTSQIHGSLARRNSDLLDYLALRDRLEGIRRTLAQRWAAEDWAAAFEPAERQAGETAGIEAAAARWLGLIKTDYAKLRSGRWEPTDGFLNLSADLVVALRDKACLCWGAVDFGAEESGDIMHFDARVGGLGDILARDGRHRVRAGHPCLAS
ncbi:hypothetical protein [Streptomyces sp. NPDC093544]|uniref:hypothetical protein n=1 Tax=Streptomyces sp. NPDC093544 TaxID=3155200 RepID=UPI00341D1F34